MSADRTRLGIEVEEALKEALAHVRGEITLLCQVIGEPSAVRRDPSAAFPRRSAEPEAADCGAHLDLDMRAARN